MRKSVRLGLLATAAAAALAFSPAALGAYFPSLSVTRNFNVATGDVVVDIGFSQTNADDPTARVQILSPFGLAPELGQSPGTQLGTFDGSVAAGALEGATVPVAGTMTAEDPTNANVTAAAKDCTGAESHTAVWRLDLKAAGQSVPAALRIYVDALATGPFSAFASTSMQLCPPPVPVSAENTLGIKLLSATLHLAGVFSTPPTAPEILRFSAMWTAVNTPYASDTSSEVDVPGTVQTQSLDRWLIGATLSAKRQTKTRRVRHKAFTDVYYSHFARLSGSVSAGCCPAPNVDIFAGEKKVVTAATSEVDGSFSTTLKLSKTTTYRAVFSRQTAVLGEPWTCQPALPLGSATMPCGTITQGGFTAKTWEVTVTKPKLTHRRIRHA
jgi:hypothetical protein